MARTQFKYICKVCKKKFYIPYSPDTILGQRRAFCSRKCFYKFNSLNPNKGCFRKGIRHSTKTWYQHSKTGYIWIYKPDYPNYQSIYVPEHKLVMEKKIGRRLELKEIVHHINGNPADNRPENLYLFPSRKAHSQYERNLLQTYYKWIQAEYSS